MDCYSLISVEAAQVFASARNDSTGSASALRVGFAPVALSASRRALGLLFDFLSSFPTCLRRWPKIRRRVDWSESMQVTCFAFSGIKSILMILLCTLGLGQNAVAGAIGPRVTFPSSETITLTGPKFFVPVWAANLSATSLWTIKVRAPKLT